MTPRRRTALYLAGYVAGWALSEWSLRRLMSAPAPADLETASAGVAEPHRFREWSETGNSCHEPGCELSREEHPEFAPEPA